MADEARSWWEEPVPPAWSGSAWPDQPEFGSDQGEQAPPRPKLDPPTGPPRDDEAAREIRDHVAEALKNVIDPELGINIVDLGLVYGIDVYDDRVQVTYTLTTMGCPIGPLIETEMERFLADVPGIEQFEAEMVFRPPWTPEMMSEEAKAALGFF
jgi:metal-sulfur cluster biosynthetic enzyme